MHDSHHLVEGHQEHIQMQDKQISGTPLLSSIPISVTPSGIRPDFNSVCYFERKNELNGNIECTVALIFIIVYDLYCDVVEPVST